MESHFATTLIAKIGFSAFIGLLIYLFGADNINAFVAVIVLCVLDFSTAMFVLYKKKLRFKSSKAPKKLYSAAKYAVVVMAFNMLGVVSPTFIPLIDIVIAWCALSEITSLLEHMSVLGIKINLPVIKDLTKDYEK